MLHSQVGAGNSSEKKLKLWDELGWMDQLPSGMRNLHRRDGLGCSSSPGGTPRPPCVSTPSPLNPTPQLWVPGSGAVLALTQEQEFPAVPVELLEVDAELVDGGPVAVLVQQHRELLDLLRGQLRAELRGHGPHGTPCLGRGTGNGVGRARNPMGKLG